MKERGIIITSKGLRLRHKDTRNEGVFLRKYEVTGGRETLQILLDDGRIYFAPVNEFEEA